METNMHRVVGIDLGTTYSAVAAYDSYQEMAEIIRNPDDPEKGSTTPSVVSCSPVDRKAIVGEAAKRNVANAPEDTIIEIKREMGETFTEDLLNKFGARGIFNIDDPVKVQFMGQWMLPQEISSFILMKMKEVAEKGIGTEIRDAVITVPAYFTERQRKATEEAALLAGLYPRQLIPEPTAAAICFGVDRAEEEKRVYLVYDLGGGTFDVSIIEVESEMINVIATSGDPRLGGGDFDDAIVEWAVQELLNRYQLDLRNDIHARAKIKYKAEKAKILLSSYAEAHLDLNELNPQNPPVLTLTRETFQGLILGIMRKSLTFVDKAIEAASKKGITRDDLNGILLVGGSSQIPIVKTLLMEHFGRDEDFLFSNIDPASVVARGAAIMAQRFPPSPPPFNIASRSQVLQAGPAAEDSDAPDVRLITEHSLGVGVAGDLVKRIIEQGTNIPVEITKGGFTNAGPSADVSVPIYQGEGKFSYENTQIGMMHLAQSGAPLEPKPQGFHQFEVTFALDANGLLSVTIHHVNTGNRYHANFSHQTGVGGDRALMALHQKLLGMYSSTAAVLAPGFPPLADPGSSRPVGAVPPPPPGFPTQPGGPTPAEPQPAQPAQPAPTSPGTPPPAAQPAQPAYPGQQPPQAPVQPAAPVPTVGFPGQPAAPQQPGLPPQQPGQQPPVSPQQPYPGQPVPPPQGVPQQAYPGQPVPQQPIYSPPQTVLPQDPVTPQTPVSPAAGMPPGQTAPAPTGGEILKPIVAVPEQFKGTVRRANKRLLKDPPAPELLQKFNAFVTALNNGSQEEDLEPLGDDLEDAYIDAR